MLVPFDCGDVHLNDYLNDQARRFYEHYGFKRLPDDKQHLYLPMADARSLVEKAFGA